MGSYRLLFVDDEPNVLRSLRRIFIDDDLDIELAANAEEALAYLQNHEVDLILSDHNMPGTTGVELLEQVKEMQPDSIRMLITGRGDMNLAMQAINQGNIYRFFNKPWEDEELHISVIRSLEFRAAHKKMRMQEQEIARHQSFRQTMVTVSHYINNFNCGLMMSLEGIVGSQDLNNSEKVLAKSALRGAEKITEVLRIMNRLQDLKTADYPYSDGMIDIDKEVQEAIKRIEEKE